MYWKKHREKKNGSALHIHREIINNTKPRTRTEKNTGKKKMVQLYTSIEKWSGEICFCGRAQHSLSGMHR